MPLIHEYFLLTLQKLSTALGLFHLSLKLNGFPIDKARRDLASIQEIPAVEVLEYVKTNRQAIVDYHLKHNAFYRNFAQGIDSTDWERIPVMTKRDFQQPLGKRLSEGFTAKNSYVNKTSGSSGDPFIFAKDKYCHALTWAGFMDRYAWFDLDFSTSKQARFYGIPLNKTGYYKERLKDALGRRFRFSVFDLSDAALERVLETFSTTRFHYINGYTSAIVQFAKFLERKNVVLKAVCPSLTVCIVTSEMLFDTDRTLLETQLGIAVVNEYGAAELGLIAFQNRQQEWVVNHEELFVEILDEHNRVMPLGETGRVVITSLYNKAHPFIRYDLGDVGALSKTSTPQKPILESLTGRTNDVVQLPSGKKAAGLTFYYVTKTVIEDAGCVKEFVIEQLALDTFNIIYVSTEVLSADQMEAVKKAIDSYLEPNLQVVFERREVLKRSERGKLKQFTSYL